MKLLTLLTALCATAFAAALPTEDQGGNIPGAYVQLSLSYEAACGKPGQTLIADHNCMVFPAGVQTLHVEKVVGGGVRYNSLRVYRNANCHGFGDIEPAFGCAGNNFSKCICSIVDAYQSVRLVVD
ncbi:hypothetical protein BU23DRAFT_267649 [Bimuria novae-zelandiae CBS 107.79]|uniref:Uncharacterized protein n=1 Tax=Bimuria novae-zelandiae CBS 107.79 TaxID=1447943 RepID=A0A6A5UU91_9PLEO|nr:hypothetical protein BU23DRAFT_267649 [Bimuria novae-zelandiae CBS 107.79]